MAATVVKRKDPKTGKEETYYETSRTLLMHWATLVAQVLVIGAMMAGILKYGVSHECKDVIDHELLAPAGSIYTAMATFRTTCRVDQSIRPMEQSITRIETIQEGMQEDIRDLKAALEQLARENRETRK